MCCIICTIAMEGGEEGAAEEEAAYQAISAKETTDLRALMQVTDIDIREYKIIPYHNDYKWLFCLQVHQ